jgi:AcrR family transcriptional regulator
MKGEGMTDGIRERLIDAAFTLFGERGFEGTTVDEIAERAGVGRTTFFRHFGSKEQVIFPDHDRVLAAIRGRLSASRPETATLAVSEAARGVLEHYVREGDRARERYALTRTVPALRDRERAGIQQYERLFTGFIHDWLGGGPETALRAQLLANAVVTAHNHVLRGWLRGEIEDAQAPFDAAMVEVSTLFGVALERGASSASGTTVVLLRTDKDPAQLRQQIEGLL